MSADVTALIDARNDRARTPFDTVTIILHWTTLLLVLLLLSSGLLHGQVEDRSWAAPLLRVHRSIGVTLWMLTVLRLIWRVTGAHFPPFPASMTALHRLAVRLSEYGLYALLLIQPATGAAHTMLLGHRIDLFMWSIRPIVTTDIALAGVFHDAHEIGAWCMIALVGLHATAALVHHFILRDDVLETMAPVFRRRDARLSRSRPRACRGVTSSSARV